jgi:hypothetical protein
VYIDEAHTVIAHDRNLPTLITQIRKYNVGLVLAHQVLSQISTDNRDALAQAAGTIISSSRGDDGSYLSRYMGCEPWVIQDCIMGEFAVYIRGQVNQAIRLKVPNNVLESMPQRVYRPAPKPPKPLDPVVLRAIQARIKHIRGMMAELDARKNAPSPEAYPEPAAIDARTDVADEVPPVVPEKPAPRKTARSRRSRRREIDSEWSKKP